MSTPSSEVKVNEEDTVIRRSLISNAYEKSPIAREALNKEKKFRKATEKHIDNLLMNIKFHIENLQDAGAMEIKDLNTAVITRLIAYGKEWEAIIAGEVGNNQHASLTPTYNKMPDIIKSALNMIESFADFSLLCQGKVPKSYEYQTADTDYTRLGNQDGIWGNAKGSNLKMVLLTMLAVLMRKKLSDLVDVDISPIVHVVGLSSNFNISKSAGSDDFFSFADKQTAKGVLLVDSGFEFGGHRFQKRYTDANGQLKPKEYGPRDCSQFIEETIGSAIPL